MLQETVSQGWSKRISSQSIPLRWYLIKNNNMVMFKTANKFHQNFFQAIHFKKEFGKIQNGNFFMNNFFLFRIGSSQSENCYTWWECLTPSPLTMSATSTTFARSFLFAYCLFADFISVDEMCSSEITDWLFLLKTVPVDTARAWVEVCNIYLQPDSWFGPHSIHFTYKYQ